VAVFDAVVVAGALYASRSHRDARRFVRRHTESLRRRPAWLVDSGPLDDSAASDDQPPVKHVVSARARSGARGQVTFGGRLSPDAKEFPARAMAEKMAGDWRDLAHVHRWVSDAVAELTERAPLNASNRGPRLCQRPLLPGLSDPLTL
jgi:menaquinone-dependent protoporphyrinogen oxidase